MEVTWSHVWAILLSVHIQFTLTVLSFASDDLKPNWVPPSVWDKNVTANIMASVALLQGNHKTQIDPKYNNLSDTLKQIIY
jgi:hypothetical protein